MSNESSPSLDHIKSDPSSEIEYVDLGLAPYSQALTLQYELHEKVRLDHRPRVIFVQHPNVITLGKNSNPIFLLFSKPLYEERGVSIVETERGGEVTAHVPGQLVVYPIVWMGLFNMSVKQYVGFLEAMVIKCLDSFGIASATDPEHPGVWIGDKKICAIGVRVKDRVSMHGIALNISNSFEVFNMIVPCGIRGRGVTSMSDVLGRSVNVPEVYGRLKALIDREIRARLVAHQ